MELTLDQALQKGIDAHKAGKAQEADRYYTAILKVQPKHPDANHNIGVLAVSIGKVNEALPFFKIALEANPSISQYWLSYIDALIKLDRKAEAKAVFDQAKSDGAKGDAFDQVEKQLGSYSFKNSNTQEPSQEQLKSLINLYSQGQFKQVLTEASQLLLKFPNSATIYNLTGAVNEQLGKLKEAIEAYNKALAIKPDYAVAYYNMGNALQDLGKLEEAIEAYSKALSINPSYAEAYLNMGNALQDLGKLEEAIEAYAKSHSIKPDYAEAYLNMGNALQEQGKLEEAIEAYSKALSINPDYAEAYYNMGNALKDLGKLEEAIEAYSKALSIKPNYAEAYLNMGNALQEQGKLEEAIEAYSKALSIKPDYAEVYLNLGNALKDQEKPEEALEAYSKALSLKPNYAEAYNNRGNALKDQGKLDEAIQAYKRALSIKPDYAEAYNNRGNALQDLGKLEEAIEAYNKAISIKPDYADAFYNLGIAFKSTIFKKPNRDLQKTIVSLLARKTSVRPKDIAKASISLLKLDPNLKKHLEVIDTGVIESPLDVISDLSDLPLLLKLMSVCPLPDLEIEKLLKILRRSILSNISSIKEVSPELIGFQSVLALQCFTNEYIYNNTEEEEKILKPLEASIKKALKNKEQPSPQAVLALASYKALNEYDWRKLLVITDHIKDVVDRQVEEPNQEEKLKQDLPILEQITDSISSEVRAQYEESPYPRWVNLGLSLKPMLISEVVGEVKLKLHDNKITEVEKPEILIAGCGTGQHSIGTAARFKGSNVLANDLSLSSLAYAKRKTKELGLKNIEYMQADILDLGQINKQFDIIESAGVLHHMDDPMAGWKALTDCLKTGGLMKIGLYSQLARQHIVKIRNEISNAGIGSSDEEMKSFRDTIIRSEKDHHKLIIKSLDFYSLSTLRDLLFHVQEHRFTILQIKDCLDKLGLKFCGFESTNIVSHFTHNNKHKDDPFNLDNWHAYEKANPRTFAGMYQFWCQKVD